MSDSMKALIVEDDPAWQRWLGSLLEQLGFTVDLEKDQNAPLHPADGTYTLALIDVSLLSTRTDQLGIQVSRKIKQSSPTTLVILLSGYIGAESAMAEVLSRGMADEVITKLQLDIDNESNDSNILINTLRRWKLPIQDAEILGRQAESAWKVAALARRSSEQAERQGLPAILLVEDQNGWITHISNLVRKAGGYAEIVNTYQHAMSLMRTKFFLIAIVDLRLSMSESGHGEGMVFIRDAIQKYTNTKFMVVSGYLDENTKHELFDLGVSYVEEKGRFDEFQYRFFEALQVEIKKYIPVEGDEWKLLIKDFLRAIKHNRPLNDTAFAKHPLFKNSNWPGEDASTWMRTFIEKKLTDKDLNNEKRIWMEILFKYYFSEDSESTTWETLVSKLHWSVRKLKYTHSRAVEELARIVYQELNKEQRN